MQLPFYSDHMIKHMSQIENESKWFESMMFLLPLQGPDMFYKTPLDHQFQLTIEVEPRWPTGPPPEMNEESAGKGNSFVIVKRS